jgi:protein ImuB
VVLSHGQTEALFNLPLEGLRLANTTVDRLHQLGFHQIGEIARLSRSSLKVRFGQNVLLRLDQLTGRSDEIIVAHRPLPEFKERWVFEQTTTNPQTIEHVLFHLLDRLTAAVRKRQQGIVELACRFELEATKPLSIDVDLYEETADAKHLFELVRLQLERQHFASAVGGITVEAKQTAPLAWRQTELFADRTRGNPRQLAPLINRLSSRLGRDHVVRPQLRSDSVSERAVSDVPLAKPPKKRKTRTKTRFAPFERPLRLLSLPVRIEVIATIPDGPPAVFFYENNRHDISHHWGPERIETAWWRGPFVRRDYYRVETTTGHRFWLFRRLRDLNWFLHGEFD